MKQRMNVSSFNASKNVIDTTINNILLNGLREKKYWRISKIEAKQDSGFKN